MSVKVPTEHHLEFLSLKGGCTDSSESTLVKIPHCWKSHVAAQMSFISLVKSLGIEQPINDKMLDKCSHVFILFQLVS